MSVFSAASYAVDFPSYCKQNGGTYECDTNYVQDGPVICNIGGSLGQATGPFAATASTIESCYLATIDLFSQRVAANCLATTPPTTCSAIPYTDPGLTKIFVPAFYAGGQNRMLFEGNSAYNYKIVGYLAYPEGVSVAIYYKCQPNDILRVTSADGSFAPGSEPPIVCTSLNTCPVDPLPSIPTDDSCAQSLHAGSGVDVRAACPQISDTLKSQLQCFANKIIATNVTAKPSISYSGPTATIRNVNYQTHLLDVWNKMIELNKPDNLNNAACKPLRDAVIAEKGCSINVGCAGQCVPSSHCIRRIPATDSNHSKGTAFDIPQSTIQELLSELTPLPPAPMLLQQKLLAQRIWISNWLSNPPACNLYWGGNFNNPPDFVHFQLP